MRKDDHDRARRRDGGDPPRRQERESFQSARHRSAEEERG
jgi:hypothetical protein